jgi:UDP-glucose-4-epimerase GalE
MNFPILVTGGAGYIGSHTCKVLADEGYTPVVLDNLSTGHRWAVKRGPLVVADIADSVVVSQTIKKYGIKAVIHFAGQAYVDESIRNPRKYFEGNVTKTLMLLDTLLEVGITKVIFSSTCATYGIPQVIPITEDCPQHPISPYGESKLFVEKILQRYDNAYGMRHVSLRYFNAAGADPDGELGEEHTPETHLIPLVIQAALGAKPAIRIFGTRYNTPDGTSVRDYVHVCDLAIAHVKALCHLVSGGASVSINLGTGRGFSIRDVISMVEAVSRRAVPVMEDRPRLGDPPVLIANAEFGQRMLGWTPRQSGLRAIVQTALDWQQRRLLSRSPVSKKGKLKLDLV